MPGEVDVLPAEIKAVFASFISGKTTDADELSVALADLKAKKDMPSLMQMIVDKVIGLVEKKEFDQVRSDLEEMMEFFGPRVVGQEDPGDDDKDGEAVESKFVFHMQVKAVGDDNDRMIEGYASVTGIRDRDGEIMDKNAFDHGLNAYMDNPVLLLNHDMKKPIGKILSAKVDGTGLWVKAQLAKNVEDADSAWNLIKQGILKAFSVGGLFKKIKDRITQWDLAEISVVTVPANQRSIFSVAKAFETGTDLVDTKIGDYLTDLEKKKELFYLSQSTQFLDDAMNSLKELLFTEGDVEDKAKEIYETAVKEVENQMPEDMEKLVTGVLTALDERDKKVVEEKTASDEREKEIKLEAVKAYKEELREKGRAEGLEFNVDDDDDNGDKGQDDDEGKGGEKRYGRLIGRYDNMDVAELLFAHNFFKAAGMERSKEFNYALGVSLKKHWDTNDGKKDFVGIKQFGQKANELMNTTGAAVGDEWVPTLEAAILWPKIQLLAKTAPLFKTITMPSNPYDYPLSSANPTLFKVAEAADAADVEADTATFTKSTITTGKITFSAGKLGALSYFSEELVEDSIIPVLPDLMSEFLDAMARGLDEMIISGDETTGSVNISFDGSSIAASSRFLVVDGLRHYGLVVNSADSVDLGSLTFDDLRTVQALMGTGGKFGVDIGNLVLICDPATGLALSDLDEVVTVDKMGGAATVLKGMLGAIKGIPIIVSEEYGLTDSAGKISATGGNNTKGSFVLANKRGVMVGYRRRITTTVDKVPYSDLRYLVASMRFDIQMREAGVVAVGFNITV